MDLLCLSLSVPSKNLSASMVNPGDDIVNEMVHHLNQSPLFAGGLSFNHLKSAIASLEMLFSDEEHHTTNFAPECFPCDSESQLESQETREYHYEMHSLEKISKVSGNIAAEKKRPPGALMENGLMEETQLWEKRRRVFHKKSEM